MVRGKKVDTRPTQSSKADDFEVENDDDDYAEKPKTKGRSNKPTIEKQDNTHVRGKDASRSKNAAPVTVTTASTTLSHAAESVDSAEDVAAAANDAVDSGYVTPDGARLMIAKIEMENFKSYAGLKTIGPFHQRFTSIVGPNGSGKSNVIDSLLFVFGKRAKQMRLDKVSELIHNSDQFPDVESCRVTVFFDDVFDKPDGTFEVVPGSSLRVTRVAMRNNSSRYYVDDRLSNYTHVTKLLRRRGIDLDHNRFLILQGEVEQIAMMKPKGPTPHETGMLEYLEDIIGSNTFVETIEKANKEVDELTEKRNEVLNRARISEREKNSLEEARREALDYLSKEKNLRQKQAVQIQYDCVTCERSVSHLQTALVEAEGRYRAATLMREEAEKNLSGMDVDYVRAKKELEQMQKALVTSQTNFEGFERVDTELREDMQHLQKKAAAVDKITVKEARSTESKRKELQELNDSLKRWTDETERGKVAVARQDAALDELLSGLRGQSGPLHDELDTRQRKLMPYSKKIGDAEAAIALIQSKVEALTSGSNSVSAALSQAEKELADIELQRRALNERIQETTAEQNRLLERRNNLERDLHEAMRKEAEAEQAVKLSRTTVAERRSAAEVSENRLRPLKVLLEAKQRGRLAGNIYGRLGDLGFIDAKYNVAVDVAAGHVLDHVIVDKTSTAEQCVAYLRKCNAGVASFLPLEEIQNLSSQALHRPAGGYPENVPRLFDLIVPDKPIFTTAFFFAVKDTLVANDLDQASRIGLGAVRHRVVSLQGEIVDKAGTLTGGNLPTHGNGQKGGAVSAPRLRNSSQHVDAVAAIGAGSRKQKRAADGGADSADDDIQSFERAVQVAEQILQDAQEARMSIETELESLANRLNDIPSQLDKMNMEVAARKKQCANVEKRIAQLRSKSQVNDKQRKELESFKVQEVEHRRVIEVQTAESAKLEAEVEEIRARIDAVGGQKVEEQRERVRLANEALEGTRSEKNKLEVKTHAVQKAVDKGLAAIAKAEADKKEIEVELVAVQEKNRAIEQQAFDVLRTLNELKAAVSEKEASVNELSKRLESVTGNISKARTHEIDEENRWNVAKLAAEQNEIKHSRLMDQLVKAVEKFRSAVHQLCQADKQESEAVVEAVELQPESVPQPVKSSTKRGARGTSRNAPTASVMEVAMPSLTEADTPLLSEEALAAVKYSELVMEIGLLQEQLQKVEPSLNAIALYREKEAHYLTQVSELAVVSEQREKSREALSLLRKQRLDMFMEGFAVITMRLKEMYQMITRGGDAELELVDSLDPFAEGIAFSVRPPKKSWKNITNLSGGEKTLSSLALVFALHHYRPTPLYVMDEIDAALDFKNVSIIAHYIRERTKNAQFLIISLRNNMFELADRLVGIYKTNNCTKSVAIDPNNFQIRAIPISGSTKPFGNSALSDSIPSTSIEKSESRLMAHDKGLHSSNNDRTMVEAL